MRQTLAIFLDAYRELNSKKLFWVVLAITLAFVIALALPSNNERGISIFGFTLDVPFFSTKALSHKGFYIELFSTVGISFWLTWGATILALVSTASIIPDLVTGGSIDLLLSKPIGRWRLFLTKYAAGLVFVGLQAAVFVVGAFLVIWIRGGAFRPQVLLAVPIVVVFYSYLFCICALVGMVTRSMLAALLATIVIWLAISGLGTVENILLDQKIRSQKDVKRVEGQIDANARAIETVNKQLEQATKRAAAGTTSPPTAAEDTNLSAAKSEDVPVAPSGAGDSQPENSAPPPRRRGPGGRLDNLVKQSKNLVSGVVSAATETDPEVLEKRRDSLASMQSDLQKSLGDMKESEVSIRKWHTGLFAAKTVLPKTKETVDLFGRYALDPADREGMFKMIAERTGDEYAGEAEKALLSRSLGWIVGTSLLFELVILGITGWIFARRDF